MCRPSRWVAGGQLGAWALRSWAGRPAHKRAGWLQVVTEDVQVPNTPLRLPCLQHMLAGMKRAKREEDGDETPSQKRQRMGK